MKPPKSIPEQIEILKKRKLIIEDEAKAEEILLKYNYYRLSGYWRKYQINPKEEENDFKDNITFEQIVAIYELDTSLKSLLQKGIGIFEVCFRTRFAYHTALSGKCLYLNPDSYNNKVIKDKQLKELIEEINIEIKRSKEKFIKHSITKYGEVPIWAAVEVLSFGTISKMYFSWADKKVIQDISSSFKVFKGREISKYTIHSLVMLRNLCAHYARIWNRRVIVPVTTRNHLEENPRDLKRKVQQKDFNKRYHWGIISILMALVDEINKDKNFSNSVNELCKSNEEFFKGLIDPTL